MTSTNTRGCEFPNAIRGIKIQDHEIHEKHEGEFSCISCISWFRHLVAADRLRCVSVDWIRVQGFARIELAKDSMMAILGSMQRSDS